MLPFLYQAEPQDVDEGRRDDKVSMEVRVHHGPHRDQCLGSSDPAALGQEEVAHPHLFTYPGPLVPLLDKCLVGFGWCGNRWNLGGLWWQAWLVVRKMMRKKGR